MFFLILNLVITKHIKRIRMIYLVAVYTKKVLNPKMGFDSFFMKKHYNKRVVEFKTIPSNDELKEIIKEHYLKNRFLEYFSRPLQTLCKATNSSQIRFQSFFENYSKLRDNFSPV